MFGFGFSELMVIAIVALVVLGPERLPKAARFAGLWVRRARNQWDSVKQELERELHAEELKREMQSLRQTVQDADNELRASGEAARRQVQQAQDEARQFADDVRTPAGSTAQAAAPDAPLDGSTAPASAPAPASTDARPDGFTPAAVAPAHDAPPTEPRP